MSPVVGEGAQRFCMRDTPWATQGNHHAAPQCGCSPRLQRMRHMSIHLSRRALQMAALALAATVPLRGLAQGADRATLTMRAVIQVSDNDPQKWNLALNNARNVLDDLGGPEGAELEIVVYGPGIGMLKADSPVAKRVADALAAGVKVVACENTMKA